MVTLEEFMEELRLQLDDVPASDEEDESARLWKTSELHRYIDRAQDALCVWTNYLPGELTLPVFAEDREVILPYRVIDITDAYLVAAKRNLAIRNRDELNNFSTNDYGAQHSAGWRDARAASATTLVLNYAAGQGLLVPEPQIDDELTLVGSFLPHRVSERCKFFTNRPDHVWALMPHVKQQAYSKHDADAYDPQLSDKYRFEALEEFNRVDHQVKLLRNSPHKGSGTMTYGGIR